MRGERDERERNGEGWRGLEREEGTGMVMKRDGEGG